MSTQKKTLEMTSGIACSCGHEHSHEGHEHHHDDHEMTSGISCSCGHDHCHEGHGHHHEDHEMTSGISCSCGHDHSHEGHEHHHDDHEMTSGISCSCGHDHCHEGHGHHEMTDGVSCSCGHDHSHDHGGHTHTHDHGPFGTAQKAILAGSFAVAAAGLLIPMPEIARLVTMGIAVLMAGYPLFRDGLKGLRHFSLDETALLTVAVVAAFAIGEYFEAFIVTALFRVGNLLENAAVERSKRDIEALTQIRPDHANILLADGKTQQAWAADVAIGTTIIVKPGEKVPLDARVISGSSLLDTSALTGESTPRPTAVGDEVLSGTVNMDGVLTCETINTFDNSAASRIIEMVKESAAKKGKTENLISRFAKVYTPFIIVAAAALAFLPPILGMGPLTMWVSRSLVFLVASCPCALVISIPLSFFAGVGANSKIGVLVKGSKYIETLANVKAVVLDKTGTITTGKLTVSNVTSTGDLSEAEVLTLAAKAESYSNHPMAQAVVAYHGEVDLSDVTNYNEISGKGVSLTVGSDPVLCGSYRLMADHHVDISALPHANIYVAKNGTVVGYIQMFDEPRPEAKEAIAALKRMGIHQTIMLTGDEDSAAQSVKEKVGLDAAYSQLLPGDKVERLEQIKKQNGITVFVGDGINDAPVLASSDAGIAMGLGTDAAIEAADVVLMSENLNSLAQAIAMSRRTVSIAKFNIIFALSIKAVVLVLGALGMAEMWMAVFADVGVSVLAVLNATRILQVKK